MTTTPTRTAPGTVPRLIEASRFEVIPLKEVEEKVHAFVPKDVTLTVTVSPVKGLEPSFELVETFIGSGYTVVPHLTARLVRGKEHLAEIVARFQGLGVRDVFVLAGDAEEAAGPYEGAAPLLRDLAELGHPFDRIGIGGYPETHPLIDAAGLWAALAEKAPLASYVSTQICFDSKVTARWIDEVWARGHRLPVYVGIPGAVDRAKLLRVSSRIGIGESIRFLRKHGSFVTRFLQPGGFSPDKLIKGLGPALTDPEGKIAGFHVFTFNDLDATEEWRQRKLAGR